MYLSVLLDVQIIYWQRFHLLCPDPRGFLHGQEPPHPIGGVHQVILWRHGEGGQVLQQVGWHPAA